ncbi:hypothetical protein SAY87_026674 [Trapa incisa]|uniref:SCP domain-containing protein n=1 Tax=Trapa incisa TaxID=236973 RepID=A0AAN7GM79_9MYRT|nr:hypothetical protein SAY87_026674 [Trapa incisa]
MRLGLASTTLATTAIPMTKMSIVQIQVAAIFLCLAGSVRAETLGGSATLVTQVGFAGVDIFHNPNTAHSHGGDKPSEGGAVPSHDNGHTAAGHGGNTHPGNESTLYRPSLRGPFRPRLGTAHIPGIPMSRPREFLTAHNRVRASVNVPPLKWDNNVARYARRFAAKRAMACDMIHSRGPYGENIFWGQKDEWSPTQVVNFWAAESRHYNKNTNTCSADQVCGHYTQVVWQDSTKLGCATVKCFNGGMYAICNYDPPGNYTDESPFESHVTEETSDSP